MNSTEVERVNVLNVSEPYKVIRSDGSIERYVKLKVLCRDEHEGEEKKLTVSDSVYPINEIKLAICYMVICDDDNNALFFECIPASFHGEFSISEAQKWVEDIIHNLHMLRKITKCCGLSDKWLERQFIVAKGNLLDLSRMFRMMIEVEANKSANKIKE